MRAIVWPLRLVSVRMTVRLRRLSRCQTQRCSWLLFVGASELGVKPHLRRVALALESRIFLSGVVTSMLEVRKAPVQIVPTRVLVSLCVISTLRLLEKKDGLWSRSSVMANMFLRVVASVTCWAWSRKG
jgi:hypothetical protein